MRRTRIILRLSIAIAALIALSPMAHGATELKHVEITAKRFSFEPAEITLKRGEPVDLVLKSADVAHGLRFRELNVDLKVGKGATTEVQFTPSQAGTFVGHCSVFCGGGHGSMMLKIHVVD
jgi:cytochrome c oxidase subunit II